MKLTVNMLSVSIKLEWKKNIQEGRTQARLGEMERRQVRMQFQLERRKRTCVFHVRKIYRFFSIAPAEIICKQFIAFR